MPVDVFDKYLKELQQSKVLPEPSVKEMLSLGDEIAVPISKYEKVDIYTYKARVPYPHHDRKTMPEYVRMYTTEALSHMMRELLKLGYIEIVEHQNMQMDSLDINFRIKVAKHEKV